jgi:hypothetical protein
MHALLTVPSLFLNDLPFELARICGLTTIGSAAFRFLGRQHPKPIPGTWFTMLEHLYGIIGS